LVVASNTLTLHQHPLFATTLVSVGKFPFCDFAHGSKSSSPLPARILVSAHLKSDVLEHLDEEEEGKLTLTEMLAGRMGRVEEERMVSVNLVVRAA
jgi:hypothetical protein